jgi:phosphoglycolate phosphatase-like HAD superfamily hydrolase
MAEAAVIFDVDGVLLVLTRAEEDAFFAPFERRYGLKNLSRDWNAYAIRNDEYIIKEILRSNGLPARDLDEIIADYLAVLRQRLDNGVVGPIAIPGASELLERLRGSMQLGFATANLRSAAKLRLKHAKLWNHVSAHGFGAEGGGHKSEILARAIAATGIPRHRIVYVGDNLNDVHAGLENGAHFIGFSTDPDHLNDLKQAGATTLSNNHLDTFRLIGHLLHGVSRGEHKKKLSS